MTLPSFCKANTKLRLARRRLVCDIAEDRKKASENGHLASFAEMSVAWTRFAEKRLASGAIFTTEVMDERRSSLSLPWLATLVCAAMMAAFVLGLACSGRNDWRIKPPRFIVVWKSPGSADPTERIARAGNGPLTGEIADIAQSDTPAIAESMPSAQVSLLATTLGVVGDAAAPLIVQTAGEAAATRKSAYTHARLPLLVAQKPAAIAVSTPAAANVASRLRSFSPAPAVAGLIYNPDLNDQVMLTAIEFPFGPSIVSGDVPRLEANISIDPARFAGLPPSTALGFAPLENRPEAPQFASFDLGSRTASWRRLSDSAAGDAFDMTASRNFDAGRSVAARSFVSPTPGEERLNGSLDRATLGTHDEDAVSDDTSAIPQADQAAPESEEAFFSPTARQVETVNDAVQRAARTQGISAAMTAQLLKLLSGEYDNSRLGPNDRLDVYFSHAGENGAATQESQLYLVRATFGGTYRAFYRYENEDGTIDYYGPEGRSARQFMLRNPVPSGRFRSGFGMRRHPILGYDRMHNGVDWSAPKGAAILATADGTVERVGANGGFGLQTVIRHDNGYTTTYAHQSAVANGVVEGASVRQGETIGFVGSTGLSTGSHIHYEVAHDGIAINPFGVVASDGPRLRDRALDAFLAERDRIDALVYSGEDAVLDLASAEGR